MLLWTLHCIDYTWISLRRKNRVFGVLLPVWASPVDVPSEESPQRIAHPCARIFMRSHRCAPLPRVHARVSRNHGDTPLSWGCARVRCQISLAAMTASHSQRSAVSDWLADTGAQFVNERMKWKPGSKVLGQSTLSSNLCSVGAWSGRWGSVRGRLDLCHFSASPWPTVFLAFHPSHRVHAIIWELTTSTQRGSTFASDSEASTGKFASGVHRN